MEEIDVLKINDDDDDDEIETEIYLITDTTLKEIHLHSFSYP